MCIYLLLMENLPLCLAELRLSENPNLGGEGAVTIIRALKKSRLERLHLDGIKVRRGSSRRVARDGERQPPDVLPPCPAMACPALTWTRPLTAPLPRRPAAPPHRRTAKNAAPRTAAPPKTPHRRTAACRLPFLCRPALCCMLPAGARRGAVPARVGEPQGAGGSRPGQLHLRHCQGAARVTRRGGAGQRRLAVGDGSARRKCWFKKDAGSSNKKAGASANVSGSKDWEGRSGCWSVLCCSLSYIMPGRRHHHHHHP